MTDTNKTADTPAPKAAADADANPAGRMPVFETIDLAEPIVRGEKRHDTLTLRKPKSGELRGLQMGDIIQADIGTVLKLLPRISDPVLTDTECANLDPADLTEICGVIRDFFMTKAERQMMEAIIADQQLKI